jgi:D-glycero-alpha-D-manno-heptose 1-phosphate guanylyltransferase
MKSDVIILAGGLGTRLHHILSGIPKPMAPVNNFPFLHYLLQYLQKFNPPRIILSVGYEYQQITSYFGNQFSGIELVYSIEETPLGTGGAIKKALEISTTNNSFVINGDTFFDIDIDRMEKQHLLTKKEVTIAVKEMQKFNRYGTLKIENDRISEFIEKKQVEKGFINAGIYAIDRNAFLSCNWPEKFSFENDFFEKFSNQFFFSPFFSDGYFIDIGIPDDYHKVQDDFKKLFQL